MIDPAGRFFDNAQGFYEYSDPILEVGAVGSFEAGMLLTQSGFAREVDTMTGKFIVIEGLDATGKSTLVDELAKSLEATLLGCPPRLEASELIDGDLRK